MSNAITLQSATAANILGNGSSVAPATSLNGGWLVFASDSTNLSIPDAGGLNFIYLKDTQAGTLIPISLAFAGQIPNSNSTTPVISDDGRYVAFQSYANNLTGADTNNDSDIFWKDTQTGTLKLLSGTSGTAGNNASGSPAISADGRYVVFQSYADNLASDDTNGAYDIYLADAQTGTVIPVSRSAPNSFGDQGSFSPSISANGQVVAFASDAINLVTNDVNGSRDVFVKNVQTGAVTLVSANTQGQLVTGRSDSPAMSADGNNVAFLSNVPDWGKAINDGYSDIFVKNLVSNTTKLVSADSAGQQANANSWSPVIDNTGQYVAFLSDATNLVSGDTNGFADVFVKEISSGKIERISADSLGGKIYGGPELNKAISISNDGKWIFFSATSNTSNGVNEVFKAANPLIDPNLTITLSPTTATIIEGDSGSQSLSFTVTLSAAASAAVTVNYATSDGTATAGSDYSATSGTLNFAAGETSKTITVPVLGDTAKESNETFTLTLSNASGATLGSAVSATATIVDNDTPQLRQTVPGTLGNDFFLPSGNNDYFGGGGSDTYIINLQTLSGAVTAKITDTEGANVIQLVDGLTIASSSFYGNAVQLTLSNGASVQILGAAAFTYLVGANAPAGDTASGQTYAQFAAALGASVPTGSTPVSGMANFPVPNVVTPANLPTPATAGISATVPGTLGNDFFLPSGGNNFFGGGGNDTYIISPYTLSGAVTAKITDTEGANVIQLVDGLTVASSSFFNNAVQLTLSNGANVQILGASGFSFQVGANAPAGDTASSQTYAQFAATLGASVPAAGAAAVSGTANYVVPSSSGFIGGIDLSSGTVVATAVSETFVYDYKMVNGRATKAGDGIVTITGFSTTNDKLVFNDVGTGSVYTKAQFLALAGVVNEDNPFTGTANIIFDPDAGVLGGVYLTGVRVSDVPIETIA